MKECRILWMPEFADTRIRPESGDVFGAGGGNCAPPRWRRRKLYARRLS